MYHRYLPILLAFSCGLFSLYSFPSEDGLEKNVRLFWDALVSRDKASALQLVHPEDLNNFLYRSEGQLNSWKFRRIERTSEKEATVVVTVNRQLKPGLVKDLTVKYTWEKTDQGWKVRVPSREEAIRKAYNTIYGSGETEIPSVLDVGPETVRIYAISPQQPGVITIQNGLESPVHVVGLDFDTERFELLDPVKMVDARSIERIRFRFIGKEEEENLASEVTLRLREGEEIHEFKIPIIYNYMNDVLRWAKKKGVKKP